jgi:hypothetical protein
LVSQPAFNLKLHAKKGTIHEQGRSDQRSGECRQHQEGSSSRGGLRFRVHQQGDVVTLVGFGTFKVVKRKARTGRNPQTGAEIKISASKAPKFVAGKALKDAVN